MAKIYYGCRLSKEREGRLDLSQVANFEKFHSTKMILRMIGGKMLDVEKVCVCVCWGVCPHLLFEDVNRLSCSGSISLVTWARGRCHYPGKQGWKKN